MILYTDEIIDLMDKLPCDREENIQRLKHAEKHGYVIRLIENGELKGYGECYRLNEIPSYPAIPWPVNDLHGKYLYCFSAVCEKGRIKELIALGKRLFPNCKIAWHREKKNHQLYVRA